MDLKSGCIFWPKIYRGVIPEFRALDRDIACDVAIIGGGISGALMAYHLTGQGIHAVLVDRRPIALGSTSASTGLLQYEIDTPLVELIEKLGREKAELAYRASLEALQAFEPLVEDLGDRCGLVPRPSLYLASEKKDVEQLQAECKARQSIGIDVEFLSDSALRQAFGFPRPAALLSPLAFEVDPYCLTLQLIFRSIERGLDVFIPTEISRCEPGENGMALHCAGGPKIRAKKVVFATGYETSEFLPPGLCELASTYALASQPIDDFSSWPRQCMIWESARPYLYARTTEDGRAIVGGEDVQIVDPKKRDALLAAKTMKLCDRFGKLLPRIRIEPDCAWAGTFSQTKDGLPYIGSLRNLPHGYFALGYGGNGITFSLLAAKIITDAFLGRENEYSELFGFDR